MYDTTDLLIITHRLYLYNCLIRDAEGSHLVTRGIERSFLFPILQLDVQDLRDIVAAILSIEQENDHSCNTIHRLLKLAH